MEGKMHLLSEEIKKRKLTKKKVKIETKIITQMTESEYIKAEKK